MAGVAMVTGATGGIGLHIASGLAQTGRQVVLVGRDTGRLQAAQDWVAAAVPGAELATERADLSSLAETRALGARVASAYGALSVLVNNAGVFQAQRHRTTEGHDLVLATNHLSPFVLTRAMEGALRAGAPARVVTVGSAMSDKAQLDLGDMALDRGWTMTRAYGRSKLLVLMAALEQARQWESTGITVNVVHPGLVATGIVRSGGVIGVAWRIVRRFARTPAEGADTPVHVATAPQWEGVTGQYVRNRRAWPPNPAARDPALCRAVWDATERMVGPR